jgi:hypothetical protein
MRRIVAVLLLLVAGPAAAQLEEIVVTASRSSDYSDYSEMPAVTLVRPADFLVQAIQLINDSRSPDLRRTEIRSTIEKLLKRAAESRNFALSYGQGFLLPVSLDDESLQIIESERRTDTSTVDIFVKVTLAANDDTRQRILELRRFIEKAELVGRTEIDPRGDVGLSIVGPERYRPQILERIAAENAALVKLMGANCRVRVGGLEHRVQWERTAVAELTLYIPYGVQISDCRHGA